MKKGIQGEFPDFCYKFYKCKKYAVEFIQKGSFRLGSLESYRSIEDNSRQDSSEGTGHIIEKTNAPVYGYSPKNPNDVIQREVESDVESQVELHNPTYSFCTVLPAGNCDQISKKFGKYIVKINKPLTFAEEINNYLNSPSRFLVEGHKVLYNKGQNLGTILSDDDRIELSYKQKPEDYSQENEFRFVAIDLASQEYEEFLKIELNKTLEYLSPLGWTI
ncbi:MAG: hypothetical protein ACYTET_03925 [Planctomycetota bacterium]|jgi:hypothetical protein